MSEELNVNSGESIEEVEETGTRVTGSYNDGNMVRGSNDDVFAAEFSVMMTYRKNNGGATNPAYSIPNIQVPKLPTLIKTKERSLYAKVLNISELYYDKLNEQLVEVIKDRIIKYRKPLNDGSYQKDEDGKVKLFDYHVDADSFVVKTTVNIRKSNYVRNSNGEFELDRSGKKIRYTESKGFGYIDYEDVDGVRYFLYSVPKKYLYKANMTALVLSSHAHPSSYYGYKLAFVNGLYYYLCVIKYRREQNDNTSRVLGIADKVDFKPEISELLTMWQGLGKYKGKVKPYMFNTHITEIPYASGNLSKNVGCMFFRGKLAMETYESREIEPFGDDGEEE